MREFCRSYINTPEVLQQAMKIGWTQNVTILEAGLTLQEKEWYIHMACRFNWTKAELLRQVEVGAGMEQTRFQTNVVTGPAAVGFHRLRRPIFRYLRGPGDEDRAVWDGLPRLLVCRSPGALRPG